MEPLSTQQTISVKLENGERIECAPHTAVKMLAGRLKDEQTGLHYVGALFNNEVVSLSFTLETDGDVRFLALDDPRGWRIYRRSVSFLLAMVVHQLYPKSEFTVEHSLGTGFYCSFELDGSPITAEQVTAIDARMREWVEKEEPILRKKISYSEALEQFAQEGQDDKLNLLHHRNPARVVVYCCDGFSDLAHGPLADNTRALRHFRLLPYEKGFVIQFPDRDNAPELPEFERQPHLFRIFQDHKRWGRILGVRTVGDLNALVGKNEIRDMVQTTEAFHEKNIAKIADHITQHKERIRVVLIAGPSSSGKTTFSKRLSVQLRVNGLHPVTISVDDYFVDRILTPRDEDGKPDFENLETIDLALFNEHLNALQNGASIPLPRFNFHEGCREQSGVEMRLEDDQILLIEGIHGLNPKLTEAIDSDRKYRIYISALTQLNLDNHNRISTTDNRLLRRMVRDNAFRGNAALTTLEMWPSVRRGEKTWIFPFQHHADIAFNSALEYEMAVLKPLAEPLLASVKPAHDQYAEACRLQEFLDMFVAISPMFIPGNSLLREFVGQSVFRY